jgi:predicted N-acetyltransferase YhbS
VGKAREPRSILIVWSERMSITIRPEIPSDAPARERLLDQAFGKRRHAKTSARLRQGRVPSDGLAFTAVSQNGKVLGTVRLWDVIAGSAGPALLLGPLAVDKSQRGRGLGKALMEHALNSARVLGHDALLLVGDAPYYGRFGFTETLTRSLHLPGPVERCRFLGLELTPHALDGAEGLVSASGSHATGEKAAKAA